MLEKDEYERFCRLRARLASILNSFNKAHPYENDGVFKIVLSFPSVYHDLSEKTMPAEYEIGLTLCLDDEDPHIRWWGRSFSEALSKCEEDIKRLVDYLKSEVNCNG